MQKRYIDVSEMNTAQRIEVKEYLLTLGHEMTFRADLGNVWFIHPNVIMYGYEDDISPSEEEWDILEEMKNQVKSIDGAVTKDQFRNTYFAGTTEELKAFYKHLESFGLDWGSTHNDNCNEVLEQGSVIAIYIDDELDLTYSSDKYSVSENERDIKKYSEGLAKIEVERSYTFKVPEQMIKIDGKEYNLNHIRALIAASQK